ncbi:hypothetical protein [Stackebrandtia nassauensis]|uniref:Uncharacterized protein n=1 Tax=Stackebrandtia nassauensis (strain DSM 44728 / CIP 108903 / NRRL B-16338 / NBRC 102104 / LLR-40K-21) TaxID=446470 RepID=D3PUP0_STANL|nr:hypothetical protein [Stackebrandtia nassauensis]ADD43053.1 conserved hypothetical protein [Stackebrandtia nassauensis DSM 44728]
MDDWIASVSKGWRTQPVHVPHAWHDPPLDPDRLFALTVRASLPFRAGFRFQAVTDVRFSTATGIISAPGDLLPDDSDANWEAYRRRLPDDITGPGFRITVTQPLWLDFPLWSRVRDLVRPLWESVGYPVLPVAAEINHGGGHRTGHPPLRDSGNAVLTFVLRGRLTTQVFESDAPDEPAAEKWDTSTGGVVYLPAGTRFADNHDADCVTLRLRIPADRRLASASVFDLVNNMIDSRRISDKVPYVDQDALRYDHGGLATVPGLADTGHAFRELVATSNLPRIMRILWTRRVSACGLEPAPAPRHEISLYREQLVRLREQPVRMPQADDSAMWAVNGHVFAVEGSAADHILDRLRGGEAVRVGALWGQAGPTGGITALLSKLHALRGIDLVKENG